MVLFFGYDYAHYIRFISYNKQLTSCQLFINLQESLMLNTLLFNMLVPTPFVFMQRSSRLLNRTRLVLFYVKNILAHHLFNCNVVWFVLGIIFWLIHVAKFSSFTFWILHIICLTKCLARCFICLSQYKGLCLFVYLPLVIFYFIYFIFFFFSCASRLTR